VVFSRQPLAHRGFQPHLLKRRSTYSYTAFLTATELTSSSLVPKLGAVVYSVVVLPEGSNLLFPAVELFPQLPIDLFVVSQLFSDIEVLLLQKGQFLLYCNRFLCLLFLNQNNTYTFLSPSQQLLIVHF
jgi:hypothetical protein